MSTGSTTRADEATRIRSLLKQARNAVEGAAGVWCLWADSVRKDIEAQHGASYEPDDPALLKDPQYGRVPDIGAQIGELHRQLAAAVSDFGMLEPGE
jgi:hypothetical protein